MLKEEQFIGNGEMKGNLNELFPKILTAILEKSNNQFQLNFKTIAPDGNEAVINLRQQTSEKKIVAAYHMILSQGSGCAFYTVIGNGEKGEEGVKSLGNIMNGLSK